MEYGIVGEVLLWSMRLLLGKVYTAEVHRAWIRMLCRMLAIMVPRAAAYEMHNGSTQQSRISEMKQMLSDEGYVQSKSTTQVKHVELHGTGSKRSISLNIFKLF